MENQNIMLFKSTLNTALFCQQKMFSQELFEEEDTEQGKHMQ